MRVLIATQYFRPEITAPAARLYAFATGLARRGHQVEVICGLPNHPTGEIAAGYRGRLIQRRDLDGVDVRYVWLHATPSKVARARLLNYASYAASATIVGASRRGVDVVIASSPPLSVGSVGATLAVRQRTPWIFDVRDLWPDAAVALGQLPEGRMLSLAQQLERRLYRSAARITATSEPSKRAIETRGGSGKVTMIPNGTEATFIDAGDRAREPELLGDDGRFTWTYPGNLGLVAGLETAVMAAQQLGDGFRLVLLGEGPRRESLKQLASALPPGAVVFRHAVPPAEAARLMRASDALLASRAPEPALDSMVLSKLYDCCAVGRPVIVSAAGETRRIAADAGAALCVPPGDPQALAAAVRRLRNEPGLSERLAEQARVFAKSCSRERGVDRLAEVIAEVTAKR